MPNQNAKEDAAICKAVALRKVTNHVINCSELVLSSLCSNRIAEFKFIHISVHHEQWPWQCLNSVLTYWTSAQSCYIPTKPGTYISNPSCFSHSTTCSIDQVRKAIVSSRADQQNQSDSETNEKVIGNLIKGVNETPYLSKGVCIHLICISKHPKVFQA